MALYHRKSSDKRTTSHFIEGKKATHSIFHSPAISKSFLGDYNAVAPKFTLHGSREIFPIKSRNDYNPLKKVKTVVSTIFSRLQYRQLLKASIPNEYGPSTNSEPIPTYISDVKDMRTHLDTVSSQTYQLSSTFDSTALEERMKNPHLNIEPSPLDEVEEERVVDGIMSISSDENEEIEVIDSFSAGDLVSDEMNNDEYDEENELNEMDVVDSASTLTRMRLLPLSQADRYEANNILRLPASETIIIEKFNIPFTQRLMTCLRPCTWLNDEVVNFYMHMLKERDTSLCELHPNERTPSHFFNSFFMQKLLEFSKTGYDYSQVKRWTKKVDLFEMDKVFFPINISNSHWTMLVVFMKKRKIQYYDSMAASGRKYLEAIMRYIKDEHQAKKGTPIDMSDWEIVSCKRNETPQQHNGYDCGVFSIMFADFLSDNLELHFSQEDISDMRLKIALAIHSGQLSYPIF